MLIDNDHISRPKLEAYRYANFGVRFLAALLDFFILLPLVAVLTYFTSFNPNFTAVILVLVVVAVYKPAMEIVYGATVGKMICKLRVIGNDGEPVGGSAALIRYLPWVFGVAMNFYVYYLIFQIPGYTEVEGFTEMGKLMISEGGEVVRLQRIQQLIGFLPLLSALVMLFNPRHQAAHDIIAPSYVIYKE